MRMTNGAKSRLKRAYTDTDRHGNRRLYARVNYRKIRIREPENTPAFAAAYSAAVEALKAGVSGARAGGEMTHATAGSLGWLAAQYFGSTEFGSLAAHSQRIRRGVIEKCLLEPISPGGKLIMRDCPYKRVDAAHVMMLRDRKSKLPGAANNRLKYLSSLFGWAIDKKKYGLGANPVRDVKQMRYASSGFYTWTIDDVRKFEDRHKVGSIPRLAMALMLYLGARRQDAIRLAPRNMRDGLMSYVPKKTSYRRTAESHKPILPPLAEIIAATPTGLKTFLVNEYGRPFSDAGIGNRMREWCDRAGLPEATSHSLKKAGAVLCAEAGATDRQLMALFDWVSERQANTYTAEANRKKMAGEAGRMLGEALK
jgi:integrase